MSSKFHADFISETEAALLAEVLRVFVKRHCQHVMECEKNGKMPNYFSMGAVRSEINQALECIGRRPLSGSDLLACCYDDRLKKAIDKAICKEGFEWDAGGYYVWPKRRNP